MNLPLPLYKPDTFCLHSHQKVLHYSYSSSVMISYLLFTVCMLSRSYSCDSLCSCTSSPLSHVWLYMCVGHYLRRLVIYNSSCFLPLIIIKLQTWHCVWQIRNLAFLRQAKTYLSGWIVAKFQHSITVASLVQEHVWNWQLLRPNITWCRVDTAVQEN